MKTKVLLLFVIMFIQMILNAQDNKWFQQGMDAKDPKKKIEYYSKSIIKEGFICNNKDNEALRMMFSEWN